jgi:hypothetical protein
MGGLRRFRRKKAEESPDTTQGDVMAGRTHVFVGVPAVADSIHPAVTYFLLRLMMANHHKDCPWWFHFSFSTGKRPVEYARNLLVGKFLETDCQKLMMIDDDMIPDDSALQLLHVPADIVGPRMYAAKLSNEDAPRIDLCAYKWNSLGDERHAPITLLDNNASGLVDVDAVGTGFCVIDRKVLEDRRMWFDGEYQWLSHKGDVAAGPDGPDEFCPPIFRTHYAPNGRILRGEDLDFCSRAKELGYTVTAHVGVRVGHAKLVNLNDVERAVDFRFAWKLKEWANASDGEVVEGESVAEGAGIRGEAGG